MIIAKQILNPFKLDTPLRKPVNLPSDARLCKINVYNHWKGHTLTNFVLTHRIGSHYYQSLPDQNWNLEETPQTKTDLKTATFNPGVFPEDMIAPYFVNDLRYDHWWVRFRDAIGNYWSCKTHFYCNLTKDDADSQVYIELDGDREKMVLYMLSDGCKVSVNKE